MVSFTSQAKTLLSLGLTALTLGSAALLSAAPARAVDFGYDEEIGFRPPVERRVIVEERRVEERRVISPGYGRHFAGPPISARPVQFGYPGYSRPAFDGHAGYGRPVFAEGEECRVIVKKRVDPWGDVVVKRIRICN